MPAPERYTAQGILTTYLETKNITIYAHGPTGAPVFEKFFTNCGTKTMLAFVKPYHWSSITTDPDYWEHTHILLLRDPREQHSHAGFLQGMSLRDINNKRDNMFYSTHLRPHLREALNAEFDFYIEYDELSRYLMDHTPAPTPIGEPVSLFPIDDEIKAYNEIKDTKMKLEVPQWRELIMKGQIAEI